jgi:uncharacterized protein
MKIGINCLHLHLPGCTSLKEKRRRIKPLISRLHTEYNISVSELDLQDMWQEAIIGCAMISNDEAVIQRSFEQINHFTQTFFTELELLDNKVEIF